MLQARGADTIDHPGGTLLAHLMRVATLLAEWGADDEVQLAGLCHAAYGTDGFTAANELDVVRHNDEFARRYGAELAQLFEDAGRHLSESARTEWAQHQTSAV